LAISIFACTLLFLRKMQLSKFQIMRSAIFLVSIQKVEQFINLVLIFQDIGKVKKMMQSPVDDNLVVFTGKYTQVASPSLLLIYEHSQKFSLYEKIKTR